MSTTAILIGLIFTAILIGGIYLPLMQERRLQSTEKPSQLMEEELQRLISGVRDLDFDFDTGKLAEADYITQRKVLIGRGVSTLLKLDQARQQENRVDHEIERLVAAHRRQR